MISSTDMTRLPFFLFRKTQDLSRPDLRQHEFIRAFHAQDIPPGSHPGLSPPYSFRLLYRVYFSQTSQLSSSGAQMLYVARIRKPSVRRIRRTEIIKYSGCHCSQHDHQKTYPYLFLFHPPSHSPDSFSCWFSIRHPTGKYSSGRILFF